MTSAIEMVPSPFKSPTSAMLMVMTDASESEYPSRVARTLTVNCVPNGMTPSVLSPEDVEVMVYIYFTPSVSHEQRILPFWKASTGAVQGGIGISMISLNSFQ